MIKMLIKQKVKFTYRDNENIKRYATVQVMGRTKEELYGRVEKMINKKLQKGWELR